MRKTHPSAVVTGHVEVEERGGGGGAAWEETQENTRLHQQHHWHYGRTPHPITKKCEQKLLERRPKVYLFICDVWSQRTVICCLSLPVCQPTKPAPMPPVVHFMFPEQKSKTRHVAKRNKKRYQHGSGHNQEDGITRHGLFGTH